MADARKINCDILIVGAGIAGSALACALNDSGLKVVVLEKNADPLDTARGDHLKPRTCEILERWGVLSDLFAEGGQKRYVTRWCEPSVEPFYIENYGKLNIPHPYFAYLRHEKIGELLLSRAVTNDNFTLIKPCRGWHIVEDHENPIAVAIETENENYLIHPKVLVGADGRSSKVRQIFDFETTIKTYNKPLVVLIGKPENPIHSEQLTVNVCKDRIIALIPRGEKNCKVAIPETRTNIKNWSESSEAELQSKLLKFLPDVTFESLRCVDVYAPVDLQTTSWIKNDNVLLIGDSCHTLHPVRSEGMNLCIKNVHKLATELTKTPTDLKSALQRYETHNLDKTTALLEANRAHAEIMDSEDEAIYKRLIGHLSEIGNDTETSRQRMTSTAGY